MNTTRCSLSWSWCEKDSAMDKGRLYYKVLLQSRDFKAVRDEGRDMRREAPICINNHTPFFFLTYSFR